MSDGNPTLQNLAADAGSMTASNLDIGDALGGTFRLFRRNLGLFVLISLLGGVVGAVLLFISGGTQLAMMIDDPAAVVGSAVLSSGLVSSLLFVALYVLVQAVMLSVALTAIRGERPSLGAALREGLLASPKLFVISLLFWIGYMFLGMFLWVPGLIFVVVFYVVKPAAMAEGIGIFAAYGRARELSRGNRWSILGAFILMWLILSALMFVGIFGISFVLGFVVAMMDVSSPGFGPASIGLVFLVPLAIYLFLIWLMLILMTCLDAAIYAGLATPRPLDRLEASRVFD
jgi:hypothetical protein